MREKIHPDYHEITIIMTDGTEYKTKSTMGKAGDTLKLDICLLYTSPSPRDSDSSRMPSSA